MKEAGGQGSLQDHRLSGGGEGFAGPARGGNERPRATEGRKAGGAEEKGEERRKNKKAIHLKGEIVRNYLETIRQGEPGTREPATTKSGADAPLTGRIAPNGASEASTTLDNRKGKEDIRPS